MAWSLVCPANRGIGFYLTRHLLQTTRVPVVATTRKDIAGVKSAILKDLEDVDQERLTVLEVDVTDEHSISSASAHCSSLFPSSSHHLRLAFIIPGILHPEKTPLALDHALLTQAFAVNTIGPMLMAKHFLPFMPKRGTKMDSSPPTQTPSNITTSLPPHAVWLTMSARVGSTTDNNLGGWYSYRASKAGVNSFTKGVDIFLRNRSQEKAMAMAYHPGTVRTELSREFWGNVKKGEGKSGLLEPEDAVQKMVDLVCGLDVQKGRGRCWDWKGTEVLP